jgi:hypothetical protein
MRLVTALASLAVALVALVVSGCGGGSSGDASTLLRQTFSGPHAVNSGNLSFALTVSPSGSSSLNGPISLSFGGPFQNLGRGKLPQSNFTISVSAFGKTGSLGILSTGTNGYVTLSGTSYQLPASTFQRLESSFAQLASSPGTSGGGSTLGKLGIDPLHWLVNPSVVGNESVGGASTTHIRAGVDVGALVNDLNTFLQKASSLGVSGAGRIPTTISATTRQRIVNEVKSPSFDVWTGNADKTIRKLAISLTLPVGGQISRLLGGLRLAVIGMTMQYGNLNQPQRIVAPTNVRPFTEFETRLRSLLQALQATVGGSLGGTSGSSGGTTPGATGGSGTTTAPGGVQAYTQCIQSAGGNVSKMQRCAALLGGR